uniref:Uncharacterized protein n=1 Tax=Clastoptera arizonana TaxID=38151 RepID=A0A1B6E900_9HEMI
MEGCEKICSHSPNQQEVTDTIENDMSTLNFKDNGVFYFESDHLALKGNSDYWKLMKSLSLLEAQRMKLLKDIDDMHLLKQKVKENPIAYKEKILNGDTSDIPSEILVEEVPKIDWSKYDLITVRERKHARSLDCSPPIIDEEKQRSVRIRGRAYDTTKPKTFNQVQN